jgi:hypothetical protein
VKIVRTVLAYSWAALAVPLILLTFIGMPTLAEKLVKTTGLKVAPKFSGGEVARTIEHEGYSTVIHEPSFDGLLRPCEEGFVQIDWKATSGSLPETIVESVDYNLDGSPDFSIKIRTQTNQFEFTAHNPFLAAGDRIIPIPNGKVLRVHLINSRNL